MRISELARQTGLSTATLRYYERRGIIVPASRTASGYRDYSPDAISTVRLVIWLKALGFTLREISEYYQIIIQHGSVPAKRLRSHAAAKATEIDTRIRGLISTRNKLRQVAECRCGTGECALVRHASGAARPEIKIQNPKSAAGRRPRR